ncbi:hypothetical protein NKH77_28655 [Streptomyces sp. M19]
MVLPVLQQASRESAHEVNAALLTDRSPAVSNPLTTVVLHGHTRATTSGRSTSTRGSTLSGESESIDGLAHALARVGLWNRAHGLPMPEITITGHGNRSRSTGQDRADSVAEALGARLAQLLDAFQTDATGPRVRVRDFGLTVSAQRVRAGTDPVRGVW